MTICSCERGVQKWDVGRPGSSAHLCYVALGGSPVLLGLSNYFCKSSSLVQRIRRSLWLGKRKFYSENLF